MRSLVASLILLAPSAAFAENAGAVSFTAPMGWTRVDDGGVTRFLPPGEAKGGACFLAVLPPEEISGGIDGWVAPAWRAFTASYRDVQEQPEQAVAGGGLEARLRSGSMFDGSRALYVIFYSISNGKRVQPFLFVADSVQKYQAYADSGTRVFNAVTFLSPRKQAALATTPLATGGWKGIAPVSSSGGGAVAAATPVQEMSGVDAVLSDSLYAPTRGVTFSAATPANVAGTWRTGSVSMIEYRNVWTGETAPPGGSQFAWTFKKDGTFEHAGLLQSTLGSCTMTAFSFETGSWSVKDGALTTQVKGGTFETRNTCGNKQSKRAADKATTVYGVRIGQDQAGTWIYLKHPQHGEERMARE